MTQQKIKVGPLPKQAENYGHFEEEKILNFGLALEAQLNIADQRPTFAR